MAKKTINVKGRDIALLMQPDQGEYISLTDIARLGEGDPRDYIRNWLRSGPTIEFLGVWEKVHNPDFKVVVWHHIKAQYTNNAYLMSATKWVNETNAIGIFSKAGKYGGTFAHSDIALNFANWLSPEFYVYLIKDYQRLKTEEAKQLDTDWNVKRRM